MSKPHTSTLTVEQLARKRAIDRASQRGVRERTAHHIKSLEAQVTSLSQSLERTGTLQRQVDELSFALERVMAENSALKARALSCSGADSVSPTFTGSFPESLIYSTPRQSHDDQSLDIQPTTQTPAAPAHPNLPTLSFLLEQSEEDRGSSDDALSEISIWRMLPNNVEPTCLSDKISWQYLNECDRSEQFSPPAEHDLSPLFSPSGKSVHSNTVSKLVMDIVSRFHDIAWLPEQISGYYILSLTLTVSR